MNSDKKYTKEDQITYYMEKHDQKSIKKNIIPLSDILEEDYENEGISHAERIRDSRMIIGAPLQKHGKNYIMQGAGLLGGGPGSGMLVGPGHPLFGGGPTGIGPPCGGPGGVVPARFDPIHPLPDDPRGGGVGGPPGGPNNDELPPPSGLDEDDIDSIITNT